MSESNHQENSQEQTQPDTDVHAATELPGRRLRETRESMQLSREEVGNHLRLDAELITALEHDDYSNLPSPTYICGYLRSYARLLKLPEDEIVQAYSHGKEIDVDLIPSSVNIPTHKPVNTALIKSIVIIVILILLGAGIYFAIDELKIFSGKSTPSDTVTFEHHSEISIPPAPKTEADKSHSAAPTPSSKPQAPPDGDATKQQPAPVAAQDKPATGKTVIEKLPTPKAKIPASEPDASAASTQKPTSGTTKTPATASVQSDAATQANLTAAATAVLRMHFTGNSWVEVTDSTNKQLVYRLVEKDSDLNLVGVPPFTILLGNAPVVQVFYKGKEFDHTNYHRNQVANFKIGAKPADTNQ